MIKVITKEKIESQNKFNNQRGNPRKYTWYKNKWKKALEAEFFNDNFKKKEELRTVIIISVRSRMLDYGNLVGGSKPILDIFQDMNILYDDSPRWLRDFYFQEIDGKNQRTEIIIF